MLECYMYRMCPSECRKHAPCADFSVTNKAPEACVCLRGSVLVYACGVWWCVLVCVCVCVCVCLCVCVFKRACICILESRKWS
jgi:hypothetical protein